MVEKLIIEFHYRRGIFPTTFTEYRLYFSTKFCLLTNLNQQRSHPFPIRHNAAHITTIVVCIILPPVRGRCAPALCLVPPPLAQQTVIAECAHQRRAIFPELFRILRTDVFQQSGEERCITALWPPVQHAGERQVRV